MAFYHKDKSRSLRNTKGVRGGVAYRELSDNLLNDWQYAKWVFVAVNAVLALLSLLAIFVICRHFVLPDAQREAGREDTEIYYTLAFYDVDGVLATAPAVGTALIDPESGAVMGEITAISTEPATAGAVVWQEGWQTLPENAVPSTVELPYRIVSVTVCTTAAYREEQGYTKNGVRLATGATYTVSVSGTLTSGVCTALRKGESDHGQ